MVNEWLTVAACVPLRQTWAKNRQRFGKGGETDNEGGSSARLAALMLLRLRLRRAQTSYPEQSVRILVGFPAGTAPDVAARMMADKMAPSLGQAGHHREHLRRGRQHRLRQGREVAARRLHAGHVRQLVADHERQPVRQAPVRSGEGLRADQPDLRRRKHRSSCIPTCRRRASPNWSRSRRRSPAS